MVVMRGGFMGETHTPKMSINSRDLAKEHGFIDLEAAHIEKYGRGW